MPRFEVKQSAKLNLTSYSGLALIGQCCQAAQVEAVIDPRLPVSQGMRSSDLVKSVVGLLSLGKSDFEAIEPFRGDRFFKEALGLAKVPGSVWMRQRLDARAAELRELTDELSLRLLERTEALPEVAEPGDHERFAHYVRKEKIAGLWPLIGADSVQDGDIRKFEEVSRTHPSQLALFHVGRDDAAGCFRAELAELAADTDGGGGRTPLDSAPWGLSSEGSRCCATLLCLLLLPTLLLLRMGLVL